MDLRLLPRDRGRIVTDERTDAGLSRERVEALLAYIESFDNKSVEAFDCMTALRELLSLREQHNYLLREPCSVCCGDPERLAECICKDSGSPGTQVGEKVGLRMEVLRLREQLARQGEREKALREALEKITRREGRFSTDQLEHASNAVEDMAQVAEEALAAHREDAGGGEG